MGRREPRPPRPPRPWTAVLAYVIIALGVAAALFFALRPVEAADANGSAEGCGDPAVSIVINGEGSDVIVGKPRHQRTAHSQCYHDAVNNLIIAGGLLVASFALVGGLIYLARRDPDLDVR